MSDLRGTGDQLSPKAAIKVAAWTTASPAGELSQNKPFISVAVLGLPST